MRSSISGNSGNGLGAALRALPLRRAADGPKDGHARVVMMPILRVQGQEVAAYGTTTKLRPNVQHRSGPVPR
eukprot:11167293-Lingulodinium_polyedra.AAC.1